MTGKANMTTTERLRSVLRDALQIGARANSLNDSSALVGAIPEFDSMAVVSVLTIIEEEFGIVVADDEAFADVFATFGSLRDFVDGKLNA